uniref:Uncharacterized protein n=1 Tax=Opuntia streptacantha TaxID=393608 RepID=A0A7C9FD71_OPUST
MVARATVVASMATGVIASMSSGVTRVAVGFRVLMSARNTPQFLSTLRWKKRMFSLPHVGQPPFFMASFRLKGLSTFITKMSVWRSSISPSQPPLSWKEATAIFFPDGDTAGLRSASPLGVRRSVLPVLRLVL